MSTFLSALLFSLSSNLDNLVVGIAYGIKKINMKLLANLIIAIITSTGTFLAMSLGSYISAFLSEYIANILGSAVIIILGLYFVIQSILKLINNTKSKKLALKNLNDVIKYAEESDLDRSGDISIKESLFVAFGLTFNNLGTGVAASIAGISIEFTVIFTFILSVLTIIFGQSIGNHMFGNFFGKYAPLSSGILLIILGIIQFFN
ncbi:manganese efflux pump [Clostridium sp. cel8]|jgi:putative sporulation protein YtaF|uniref:manganese efflux pump n=1 Tax=unclassified Clostridium TaxID=2614128 RepID=UPI0015F70BB1|nr:manganese efflux pump [Clostridium sp. cel8]MBA5850997.1 manganese efflux pump [Clostridium sp. cel8]